MPLDFSAWQPALLVVAYAGIALLFAGFFSHGPRSALFRMWGWILFGAYWPFQAPTFFWGSEPDPINGYFCLLGPLFLWWIAYHERRSYEWKEDPPALRWFAGASAVSAATYFIVFGIPAVSNAIILTTAQQSNWLLKAIFGIPDSIVVQDVSGQAHIFLHGGTEYAVTVIAACTAVQSMMIFVGAIACLQAARNRKLWGLLMTVPVVWVLNLFRNAGIVYGYKYLHWSAFGLDSFEWMHSYIGKIGSLVALVVIALGVFATLPELHGNILDLFDLRKRRAPGFFKKPPQVAPVDAPVEA